MSRININTTELNKAIHQAFDATVDKQSDAFDEALSSEEYPWPRPTKRRNREIARSPRDIVDTGKLLESKVVARSSSQMAAEFSWGNEEVNYAAAVHNGCTLKSGTELPARPWTERAVEECDPKAVFEKELRRRL